MIMLSQPLTIEDWMGNVYLIKPIGENHYLPSIINSSSPIVFKKPKIGERKSKMIKRIMVAKMIDKNSISALLKSLKTQLEVDLNVDNIIVFKLSSKSAKNKPIPTEINKKCYDRRLEVVSIVKSPPELSSKLESSCSDCQDSVSTNNIEQLSKSLHSELMKTTNYRPLSNKIPTINTYKDEQNSNSRFRSVLPDNPKFTFFTCWHINDKMKKNYFFLPRDKLSNLISYPIRQSKKILLTRYIKMIEKIAETRIKYKSIMQSRRVENLYYRKVIITAKDRNGIWLSLQLLKEHLNDVIKNAVFYQPSLQPNPLISTELLSELKTKNQLSNINNDMNNGSKPPLSKEILYCNSILKLSKIPVLLSHKYHGINNRISKQLTSMAVLPNMKDYYIISQEILGNQYNKLSNIPTM